MINIKNKNIENVYFGNKIVEKVYCGSKLVFENKKSAVTDDTLLRADFNNIFNDTEFWSVDRGNIAYLEDDCIFLKSTVVEDKNVGDLTSYNPHKESLISKSILFDETVASQSISVSVRYKGCSTFRVRQTTNKRERTTASYSFYSPEDEWTTEHFNLKVDKRYDRNLKFTISPGKKKVSESYLIEGIKIKWIVVKKGSDNFVDEF